jgi:hypothetical protein
VAPERILKTEKCPLTLFAVIRHEWVATDFVKDCTFLFMTTGGKAIPVEPLFVSAKKTMPKNRH